MNLDLNLHYFDSLSSDPRQSSFITQKNHNKVVLIAISLIVFLVGLTIGGAVIFLVMNLKSPRNPPIINNNNFGSVSNDFNTTPENEINLTPSIDTSPCSNLPCSLKSDNSHPDLPTHYEASYIWSQASWIASRQTRNVTLKKEVDHGKWFCQANYYPTNELTLKTQPACVCFPNYQGPMCLEDVDECLNNPCTDPNTVCVNTLGSHFCPCKNGYSGDNCGIIEKVILIGAHTENPGLPSQNLISFLPSSKQSQTDELSLRPVLPFQITDFCTVNIGEITVIIGGSYIEDGKPKNNLKAFYFNSTSLVQNTEVNWQLASAELSFPRLNSICATVHDDKSKDDLILICGGSNQNQVIFENCEVIYLQYLLSDSKLPDNFYRTWTLINDSTFRSLKDTSFAWATGRKNAGMVTTNDNKVWMFGGETMGVLDFITDDFWEWDVLRLYSEKEYDPYSSEMIIKQPSLPNAKRYFGYAYYKNMLFIAGGETNNMKASKTVEFFDKDGWHELTQLPEERIHSKIMYLPKADGLDTECGPINEDVWFILGGENKNGITSDVLMYKAGVEFCKVKGLSLPYTRFGISIAKTKLEE